MFYAHSFHPKGVYFCSIMFTTPFLFNNYVYKLESYKIKFNNLYLLTNLKITVSEGYIFMYMVRCRLLVEGRDDKISMLLGIIYEIYYDIMENRYSLG